MSWAGSKEARETGSSNGSRVENDKRDPPFNLRVFRREEKKRRWPWSKNRKNKHMLGATSKSLRVAGRIQSRGLSEGGKARVSLSHK